VPIRKPMSGELDYTSGFGMRRDPFVRSLAMHTGLDFRADTGEPARATAAGSVTHAGWNGGYGNMVEVNHGNGLSTRYGHMSKIEVKVGQHVVIGQTIGRIGRDTVICDHHALGRRRAVLRAPAGSPALASFGPVHNRIYCVRHSGVSTKCECVLIGRFLRPVSSGASVQSPD